MAFEWLNKFHREAEKDPAYSEKALAAYRLGMKAKGSIKGVIILPAPNCCDAARLLPAGKIYHPDDIPHLPLSNCPLGRCCACVYRPVMSYEQGQKG